MTQWFLNLFRRPTEREPIVTPVTAVAPVGMYWVYAGESERLGARPGAPVKGDAYTVPTLWVDCGLVRLECLE